jgi:hypothetical protein
MEEAVSHCAWHRGWPRTFDDSSPYLLIVILLKAFFSVQWVSIGELLSSFIGYLKLIRQFS